MVILSITLVYAAVFYLLYDKTRHGVVTNVNLIPILLLSWIWGVKAGLLVMLINSLICSGIIIRIITPDAIIGIGGGYDHPFFFALALWSFSLLTELMHRQMNGKR